MRNAILVAVIFIIVLGTCMVGAVYNYDSVLISIPIFLLVIAFVFFYDKVYPKKELTYEKQGRLTPEEMEQLLEQREKDECPAMLWPIMQLKIKLDRWGKSKGLYHLDNVFWGLATMLLSAIALLGFILIDPSGSEDLVGGISAFILICLAVGLIMVLKGVALSLMKILLRKL